MSSHNSGAKSALSSEMNKESGADCDSKNRRLDGSAKTISVLIHFLDEWIQLFIQLQSKSVDSQSWLLVTNFESDFKNHDANISVSLYCTFVTTLATILMTNFKQTDVHITVVPLAISWLFITLIASLQPVQPIHKASLRFHISCAFVIIQTYMALVNVDRTNTIMVTFLIISLAFVATISYKFVHKYKINEKNQRKIRYKEKYDIRTVAFLCISVLARYVAFCFISPKEQGRFVIPDCLLFFSIIMGTIDMILNLSPLTVEMDHVLRLHSCAFSVVTMVTVFAYSVVPLEELAFLELIPQLVALNAWLLMTECSNLGHSTKLIPSIKMFCIAMVIVVPVFYAIDQGNIRPCTILFGCTAIMSKLAYKMLHEMPAKSELSEAENILNYSSAASLLLALESAMALTISWFFHI